jgi:ribonucleoside-diphosphate reductase alpha chain
MNNKREIEIINAKGLKITRRNTKPGVSPFDQFEWFKSDVVSRSWRDNSITFQQLGVEFPTHWSSTAISIVTTKYFRGAANTPEREYSLKQLISRVIDSYKEEGIKNKYFFSEQDADSFADELTYSLLAQQFAFNSPVWFNVGTKSPWQVSACYILAVDDNMEEILNWYKEEGLIFKGGSGAGINLSNIRSSKELLSSGGNASGPVSFMRGADSSAGTIKSGGATRRAAKMVILDVDHPDIVEFIETKSLEEGKIKVLKAAGYDMDLGGKDTISVQYQNANNSVRVNDDFMTRALKGENYDLIARGDKKVIESINASTLLTKISQAAWECADPGIQYDNAIQKWHTLPNTGRISATNPCSEFIHLDNSSCNLASIKITSFYNSKTRNFDLEGYQYLVRLLMTAAEISVAFGHFPTEKIGEVTKASRPIGLGYTDLGALLMLMGLAYDSVEGRQVAASITSVLTGKSYETSTELAKAVGTFQYYQANKAEMNKVVELHLNAATKLSAEISSNQNKNLNNFALVAKAGEEYFKKALAQAKTHGYRNSQTTVLAPTGTISFFMDSTTTGVEPEFSLVKFKKIADGSSMKIVNKEVSAALLALEYSNDDIFTITEYLKENGSLTGCKELREKDLSVFACAVGDNFISPLGHLEMMGAIQPLISGAISKTVNMPEESTVEDIENIYIRGWELGLKAIAIYRDNCKVGQPLSQLTNNSKIINVPSKPEPTRVRLGRQRNALTTSFTIGGADGYITAGSYANGDLGEVFLKMSKQGSTLAGVMDAFAIAVSIGLQYGVPLETFIEKFTNTRFEPSGMTNDPELRMASSVMDYVFRRLAIDHLPLEKREALGISTMQERSAELDSSYLIENTEAKTVIKNPKKDTDAPMCFTCGVQMQRAGACHVCPNCAATSGCS